MSCANLTSKIKEVKKRLPTSLNTSFQVEKELNITSRISNVIEK